jgi:hypothetical protein
MSWYSKKMSCCGPRKEKVKSAINVQWVFKHGSSVAARSVEEAVEKLNNLSHKDFWASETHQGCWDVQLSDSIVLYNVSADSVTEAVNKARWYVHLDKSLKTLTNIYV